MLEPMIHAESEVTMQAAAGTAALAWICSRCTGYLRGTGTQTALAAVFAPMLALTWAYLAMMRVLIP